MKEATLALISRTGSGKGPARRLRMKGLAPAVIYGPESAPQHVAVATAELSRLFRTTRGTNVLLSLDVDGKGPSREKAIIRELQRDPVRGEVLHVDFHQISMTKPLHIKIPVHVIGIADGVKNSGGILQHTLREIEISCLPTAIPEHLEIDVTPLGIHGSVHVRDISIPNVTILTDPDATLVSIVAPTVAAAPAEVEPTEVAAEPELIERKKKEEAPKE